MYNKKVSEKEIEEIIKINVDFVSNKDGISYEDSQRLPKALTLQLYPLITGNPPTL